VSDRQPPSKTVGAGADVLAHTILLDHAAPVRYLARRGADEWLAGGYNWVEARDDAFRWTSLADLLAHDPTIAPVLDLEIGWQAWRLEPTDDWERDKMPVGRTYLFVYQVLPVERTGERADIEGAFVNCWVKTRSRAWGRRIARRAIEDDDWIVLHLDDESEIVPEALDEDARAFYQQAQVDGIVLALYSYRTEDED
jgi:hypothetical protein